MYNKTSYSILFCLALTLPVWAGYGDKVAFTLGDHGAPVSFSIEDDWLLITNEPVPPARDHLDRRPRFLAKNLAGAPYGALETADRSFPCPNGWAGIEDLGNGYVKIMNFNGGTFASARRQEILASYHDLPFYYVYMDKSSDGSKYTVKSVKDMPRHVDMEVLKEMPHPEWLVVLRDKDPLHCYVGYPKTR